MARVLGGFQCSKYTLMGLNIFYILVGIILICLGTKWSHSNQVTGLPIVGGIVACGVFLIVISILGIFGTARHHQVFLFFYMLILFIVFIIQFSVACACLTVSTETQRGLAAHGWDSINNESRVHIQNSMSCCKFDNDPIHDHPTCPEECSNNVTTGNGGSLMGSCSTCDTEIVLMMQKGFQVVGGVSLFFSFTECLGVWLTMRYRNMGPSFPTHSSELI